MLRFVFTPLFVGLWLLAFASHGFAETAKVELLFVQSATSGSFDGETLTLSGIGATTYFSDRPNRIVGHMHSKTFIEHWPEGENSFESNPPNAVLSVLDENGVNDATVVLSNPKIEGDQLTYQVKLLDGKPPMGFEAASLFIDGDAGAFVGGMVAGRVLHNMADNP